MTLSEIANIHQSQKLENNNTSIQKEKSKKRALELEVEFEKKQKISKKKPLPLQRESPPSQSFPFEALGPLLGSVGKRIHEIVKAPDSICGQSVLSATALLTQPYANVNIDGRSHPLSLFAVTTAESGDRKSAVDNIVLKPIRDYEKMLSDTYQQEKNSFRNKQDIWKKQRNEVLQMSKKTASFLEEELKKLSDEPEKPLEPNILLEEPSYEGLVKLFAVGQPSMGLFSDEGGRMLGGYSMGKENALKTACGLSSLWDGSKPITRVRGGDENLLLYGRRLSMHLMIQENLLADLLKNDLLTGQGMLARCLIVYPISTAGDRPYNPTDVSKDEIIVNYWNHAGRLLDTPFPLRDPKAKNELAPRSLTLNQEAKRMWTLFHDDIDRLLKKEGDYFPIRRMANKIAEQSLRIAGSLSLINNFETDSISLDEMERGIVLCKFYLNEALRITDMGFQDPNLELAQNALAWMKRKTMHGSSQKTFSLQEIYQKAGPRGVRNKSMAQKILGILEEHGQIERVNYEKDVWRIVE